MNRLLISSALALTMLCVGVAVRTSRGGEPARGMYAHDVYFTLKDSTPETRRALVEACETYLSGHEGAASFAAGTRVEESQRDVNDREFDVSLHIYFEDPLAHAAYQKHPRHRRFIEEMQANWERVRVFDSWVQSGS